MAQRRPRPTSLKDSKQKNLQKWATYFGCKVTNPYFLDNAHLKDGVDVFLLIQEWELPKELAFEEPCSVRVSPHRYEPQYRFSAFIQRTNDKELPNVIIELGLPKYLLYELGEFVTSEVGMLRQRIDDGLDFKNLKEYGLPVNFLMEVLCYYEHDTREGYFYKRIKDREAVIAAYKLKLGAKILHEERTSGFENFANRVRHKEAVAVVEKLGIGKVPFHEWSFRDFNLFLKRIKYVEAVEVIHELNLPAGLLFSPDQSDTFRTLVERIKNKNAVLELQNLNGLVEKKLLYIPSEQKNYEAFCGNIAHPYYSAVKKYMLLTDIPFKKLLIPNWAEEFVDTLRSLALADSGIEAPPRKAATTVDLAIK